MRVGGKRTLQVPYDLAYGEDGSGAIPAKADLVFECELVSIESGLSAALATFPGGARSHSKPYGMCWWPARDATPARPRLSRATCT